MLTKLRIRNFKAWRDSNTLRLAPLTVLFGSNSAGKTSLPQLLLLLKQTAESPDRQRPLQLGDEKKLVDLGTFEDIVHGHDLKKAFEFELEFATPSALEIVDPLSNQKYQGDRITLGVRIAADKQEQPVATEIRYTLLDTSGKQVLQVAMQEKTDAGPRSKHEFEIESTGYGLVRHQSRTGSLPRPVRFYGFPEEAMAYYQNAAFTADLVLAFEQMLKSIFYVGPLREYPKRLYVWSGEVPNHVGVRGDRVVEAILASGEREFDWKPKQRTVRIPELVAERLKAMQLIHDFQVHPLSTAGKIFEVLLTTGPNLPKVKLTDVGFGLSQILPVIVECFYVPTGSIVIFEQPEIHLHPRVQADLADLFVDAVRAREGGKSRQCQFIIESHSEHFLRRLQRLVAEEELKQEDVALYFVHSAGGEAKTEPLHVDEYGNITNWPDNFFGDEMADLVARSEAQARRVEAKKP